MNQLRSDYFVRHRFVSIDHRLLLDGSQNPIPVHRLCQLVLVLEGNGTLFIADTVVTFKKGDLFILGRNLCNKLKISKILNGVGIDGDSKTISLFFDKKKIKKSLQAITEASRINKVLDFSEYGIKVPLLEETCLTRHVEKVGKATGLNRYLLFLKLLDYISRSENIFILSAKTTLKLLGDENEPKLGKICTFIGKNYKETITLKEISSIANMSPTGFCRFFKSKTKKTYSKYLAEVRVESACGLLRDTDIKILDCSYASGYNNVSNFHRHFKRHTGMSPSEYRLNTRTLSR